MFSVVKIAFANLRCRKTQSLLIALTLLLAAFLLSSALGVLAQLRRPVETMFEKQRGSHILLQMNPGVHDPDEIGSWWRGQSAVDAVEVNPYWMISEKIGFRNEYHAMGDLLVTAYPDTPRRQDQLAVMERQSAADPNPAAPAPGEIWLPTGYAYAWDIGIGDILTLPAAEGGTDLVVSAIVIDPQFSSGMMNPVRLWVSQETLNQLGWHEDLGQAMVGVRFHDFDRYESLWQEFERDLGVPFMGFIYDYDTVLNGYNMILSIIGILLLVFALIILLVAVTVLVFTLSQVILSEYAIIGIIKTQGFTAGQVIAVYLLQTLLLALLAVPAGLALSRLAVNAITAGMLRSVGVQATTQPFWPLLAAALIMLITVLLTSWLSAAKSGRLRPVEAITGSAQPESASQKAYRLPITGRLPLSLALAWQQGCVQKRKMIFIALAALVTTFVLVFSVNTWNSVSRMHENLAFWGFDNSDAMISTNRLDQTIDKSELIGQLRADERVQTVIPSGALINCAIPAQAGETSRNLVAFSYDGDMDQIGMINLAGRHPAAVNEISVSRLVSERYRKQPGDMIRIFIDGNEAEFLVTGIYQTMNSMGWGFRMQEEAVLKLSPDFRPNTYLIKLNNAADAADFVASIKTRYGAAFNIRTPDEGGEINLSGITANLALVTSMLSGLFLAAAFVIIFNLSLLGIHQNKKPYGIFKAIGLSSAQIRRILVWQSALPGFAGITAGALLALLAAGPLLSAMMAGMGLARFPLIIHVGMSALSLPAVLAALLLAAWIPSRSILKISTRRLIVE